MDDDFFSDSDGEKAVEELLSQAMDSTILEQVAAINCAGFTDSALPSHLESRFRKLKSLPPSMAKSISLPAKSFSFSHPPEVKKSDSVSETKNSDSSEEGFSPCLKKSPESKKCVSAKSLSSSASCEGFSTSLPTKSFRSDSANKTRKSDSAGEKNGEKGEEGSSPCLNKSPQSMNRSSAKSLFSSASSSEGFSSRSVSPPAKSGCFLCSPKKVSRRKNKENRGLDLGIDWGKDNELLSDLSNFSVNDRKMIKKAMEEEEKICREAEKIVKWAKHASARMDVSGIEDELSDDENAKFP